MRNADMSMQEIHIQMIEKYCLASKSFAVLRKQSVEREQSPDQHVSRMAPQKNLLKKAAAKIVGKPKRTPLKKKVSGKQVSAKKGAIPKKTPLKKKVSAKKVVTKKVAMPKKTPLKKKVLDKKVATPKKTYPKVSGLSAKKSSMKKTEPKKADVKKPLMKKPNKKSPLKKKLASKKATALAKKVGKSSAKKDSTRLNTTSNSSDERAARAAKRQAAKEDSITLGPMAKRARLDQDDFPKEDLVDLVSTSDGVAEILAASGSQPLQVICLERVSAVSHTHITRWMHRGRSMSSTSILGPLGPPSRTSWPRLPP